MKILVITSEELDSFKNEIIQELSKLIGKTVKGEAKTWLRTRDVTRILNLSTSTLQNLRNKGKIPFTKLNGIILYKSDDIDKMLEDLSKGGES